MTIQEALDVSHRTLSYRDAEILLAHVLHCDRILLHSHPEQILTPAQSEAYEHALNRREKNEPVAYITGVKEFYGRQFRIDARALIPRPETEAMIEKAVAWAETDFRTHLKETNKPCPVRILELGTGCGCIAVTVALELASRAIPTTIIATDISAEALELAQENWKHLGNGQNTGNIILKFVEADLFNHPDITKRPFDLIVANLPYVETTWQTHPEAQPDVIFHEPDVALFGGEDGLAHYRTFFNEAPSHLSEHGAIMIEYGGGAQTEVMRTLARTAFPHKTFTVHKDYADLDRVITLS